MFTGKAEIFKLSVQRRILLLLYDHQHLIDDFEVTQTISQGGIGKELGLQQTHVSRALSDLRVEGLVLSKSAHITRISRRKKVYFLTIKGCEEVQRFIEHLYEEKIPLRTKDRRLKVYPLRKAMDIIRMETKERPTLYQVLNKYFDGSEIDMMKGKDNWTETGVPIHSHFFGRKEEMDKIEKSIADDHTIFVVVCAIAGMGKTTLIGQSISLNPGKSVSWSKINEWTRPEKLLADWAKFLSENRRSSLLDFLRKTRGFDLIRAVEEFIKDIKGLNAIFVLDDFQKAGKCLDGLLELLLGRNEIKEAKFIIGTREKPDFYGRDDILVKKRVLEIELGGLEKESSLKILEKRNIPTQERDILFQLTKGHPLALELVSETYEMEGNNGIQELERYFGDELLKRLDKNEKEIIYLAAVYEEPVFADGLLMTLGSEQETIERLCDRMVIRIFKDGTYDLHDLLRSLVRKRMTSDQIDYYNNLALKHLSTRGSEREILHYMFLLEKVGKSEELLKMTLDFGENLLIRGNTQVLDILRTISEDDIQDLDLVKYLILSADEEVRSSRKQTGSAKLEKALRICDGLIAESKDEKNRKEVIEQVSRIFFRKADLAKGTSGGETIDLLSKNVKYNRKYGDVSGLGKALNNLAVTYKENGELEKALEYLEEARELFSRKGDTLAIAFVEVNKTDVYLTRRDFKKAEIHLKSAEKVRINNPNLNGILRSKIGDLRYRMKQYMIAEKEFTASYLFFKESKNFPMVVTALENLFRCSLSKGEKVLARERIYNAERLLVNLKKNDVEYSRLLLVHSKNMLDYSRKWDEISLRSHSREIIERLLKEDGPRWMVKHIEKLISSIDDPQSCDVLLEESAKFLNEMGEMEGRVIVQIWRGVTLQQMGKEKKAKMLLKETMAIAKKLNFNKAQKRIEGLLK